MRHTDFDATIKEHKEAAKQEEITMAAPITNVAEQAWNATRPKGDPEFKNCILDHRMRLITQAQAVADHGPPTGAGGTAEATAFDKRVAELLKPKK